MDLREVLLRVTEGYEAERLETAERDQAAILALEEQLARQEAVANERVSDLLDVVADCVAAILAVLDPDVNHAVEQSCPLPIRTIAARGEDALRQAGRL